VAVRQQQESANALERNDSNTPIENQSNCGLLHSAVKTTCIAAAVAPAGAMLPTGAIAALWLARNPAFD